MKNRVIKGKEEEELLSSLRLKTPLSRVQILMIFALDCIDKNYGKNCFSPNVFIWIFTFLLKMFIMIMD